jgi:hypothetical protein
MDLSFEMVVEHRCDTVPLTVGQHVGMAEQDGAAGVLEAHHSHQISGLERPVPGHPSGLFFPAFEGHGARTWPGHRWAAASGQTRLAHQVGARAEVITGDALGPGTGFAGFGEVQPRLDAYHAIEAIKDAAGSSFSSSPQAPTFFGSRLATQAPQCSSSDPGKDPAEESTLCR